MNIVFGVLSVRFFIAVGFHNPVGHYRHKCLRKQERHHHRKTYGQSQRQEQCTRYACHGKCRGKYRQYTQQDKQFWQRYFGTGMPNGKCLGFTHIKMLVDVFYGYGTFVNQYTDGKRQSAKRHKVYGLPK